MMPPRKIWYAAACLLVLQMTACNRAKGPKIYSCSPEIAVDLGTINEADGPVSFILKIENTTSQRIIPYTTATRCICLNADTEPKPVEAGDDVLVNAVYNPAGFSGKVMEELQVFYTTDGTLAPPYRYLSVMVKARIKPRPRSIEEDTPYDFGQGLHMSHEVLIFNPFREGQRGRIKLRVASALDRRAQVSFVLPAGLDSVLTCRSLELPPHGCDTLSFFLNTPHLQLDNIENGLEIYPCVNGKRCDKALIFKHHNHSSANGK